MMPDIQVPPDVAAPALAALEEAFPPGPFPSGLSPVHSNRWVGADGVLHTYESDETRELAAFFGGRPWCEVDRQALLTWPNASEALFSFTPLGLVFYLPAFFAAFLSGPLDAQGFTLAETLLSTLQPRVPAVDGAELRARHPHPFTSDVQRSEFDRLMVADWENFIALLSPAQTAAVARCLEALAPLFDDTARDNPARSALARYWARAADAGGKGG